MKITLSLLKSKGACADQRTAFRKIFGKGPAPLTLRNAKKYASVFDWNWAADKLLSETQRQAYEEACAPAWKVFNEACAPAWKVYEEACAPAWKVYDEATASAEKVYEEACAPARKVYQEACAVAFVNAARMKT